MCSHGIAGMASEFVMSIKLLMALINASFLLWTTSENML